MNNNEISDDESINSEISPELYENNNTNNSNIMTIIIPIISSKIQNLKTILSTNPSLNFILLNMLSNKTILQETLLDKNIKKENILIIECYNNGYCLPIKKALNIIKRKETKEINETKKNKENKYVMLLNQHQEVQNTLSEIVDLFIKKIKKSLQLVISFSGYVLSDKSLLDGLHTTSSIVNYLSFNGLTFNTRLLQFIDIDLNLEPFAGLELDVYEQLKKMECSFIINNSLLKNNEICEFKDDGLASKKNIERITKYLIGKYNVNCNVVGNVNSNVVGNSNVMWNFLKTPYPYDYINTTNYKEFEKNKEYAIKTNNNIDFLTDDINLNELLDFNKQITIIKNYSMISNKKVYLVMACLDYQNAGGGEKWLMDTMHWLANNNYISILFCFINNAERREFDKIKIEKENDNLIYIQYPRPNPTLIKSIKLLDPVCMSHQGSNREHYLNISKALNIPFVTGLCFWHDIINFTPKFNINMIHSKLVKNQNFDRIFNGCDYVYSSSKFVNDIVGKVHNRTFDIIETISNREHYLIMDDNTNNGDNNKNNNGKDNFNNICKEKIYVTCANIHFLKNG